MNVIALRPVFASNGKYVLQVCSMVKEIGQLSLVICHLTVVRHLLCVHGSMKVDEVFT